MISSSSFNRYYCLLNKPSKSSGNISTQAGLCLIELIVIFLFNKDKPTINTITYNKYSIVEHKEERRIVYR